MRNKKLSQDQIDELIKKYSKNIKIPDLIKEYKICAWTIYNILRENNVQKHRKKAKLTMSSITKEQINEIINLYSKHINAEKIGQIFGTSHTFILKVLGKYSDENRNREYRIREYFPNEKYFDVIDTEEKAYFLGLLYADGCNSNNILSLDLTNDKEMVYKFGKAIYKDNNFIVKEYPRDSGPGFKYIIRIASKYMTKQLTKLGCHPKKSLTLKFPNWLKDKNLIRHFIRGYFDGDGCISFNKSDKKSVWQGYWSIISTRDFIDTLYNIIKIELNQECRRIYGKYKKNNGNNITTIIEGSGNRKTLKLMNWLYKDATIYLERKYNKYLELLKICKEVDDRKAANKLKKSTKS